MGHRVPKKKHHHSAGSAMTPDLLAPDGTEQNAPGTEPDETSASSEILCWTRMQTESGEGLERIVARKNMERAAGEGLFFWGIGTSLGDKIEWVRKSQATTPLVFSKMISPPKQVDVSPADVLVWQTYLDRSGNRFAIPEHVLVTSRAHTRSGVKNRHYALVCGASEALVLADYGPLDHRAYRNAGPEGLPIGASQVTALIQKRSEEDSVSADYRINLRANLIDLQFVRLSDPCLLDDAQKTRVAEFSTVSPRRWRCVVKEIRGTAIPLVEAIDPNQLDLIYRFGSQ
jgi:hypothetical protein